MPPGLVVFDLDGTLIDSQIDLANSVNAMREHLGLTRLPHHIIAGYIGDGVSMLVRRALGEEREERDVDEAITFFLQYYRVHKLDFTSVYDGVLSALQAIRDAAPPLPMAVLTNKPVRPSREICDHLGLSPFFFQNYGGDSFATKKPDPTGLLALIAEASVQAGRQIGVEETVLVGDSDVDVLTARNCGARSVGCTFGLATDRLLAARPDVLCNSPKEWPGLLLG